MHEQYISELQKKTSDDNIQTLMANVEKLRSEVSKPFNCFDFDDSMRYTRTQSDLSNAEEELSTAANKSDIYNYYLGNGDIMLEYYQQAVKKQSTHTGAIASATMAASGSATAPRTLGTFDKLFSVAETALGPSRKKMFDEYMQRRGLSDGVAETQDYKLSEHCSDCNVAREEITSEGILVCPRCGSEEYALVVSDFPSFRDPPKERNNYAYNKQNHLN
jgi:hypothetical protein